MKVYISGKITGNPFYKDEFALAERVIEASGCEAVNPAAEEIEGSSWLDYMRRDIKLLVDCDGVYMLHNWQASAGAKIEHQLARDLGLRVYYEGAEK